MARDEKPARRAAVRSGHRVPVALRLWSRSVRLAESPQALPRRRGQQAGLHWVSQGSAQALRHSGGRRERPVRRDRGRARHGLLRDVKHLAPRWRGASWTVWFAAARPEQPVPEPILPQVAAEMPEVARLLERRLEA